MEQDHAFMTWVDRAAKAERKVVTASVYIDDMIKNYEKDDFDLVMEMEILKSLRKQLLA